MKFLTDEDAKLFLIEIGCNEKASTATKDYTPTDEEMDTFVRRRRDHESSLKDKDKSRTSKEGWRKNRSKMMRGIKAYHRSTEGKRHHKRLGRYLATRMTSNDECNMAEALKGLGSAKNCLLTELEYYHVLTEQIALEEAIIDYALPMMNTIELKIIKNEELNEDEISLLLDLTETAEVVRSLALKSGRTESEVEAMWRDIKTSLINDGHKEDDEKFYGLLVHILKQKLKI